MLPARHRPPHSGRAAGACGYGAHSASDEGPGGAPAGAARLRPKDPGRGAAGVGGEGRATWGHDAAKSPRPAARRRGRQSVTAPLGPAERQQTPGPRITRGPPSSTASWQSIVGVATPMHEHDPEGATHRVPSGPAGRPARPGPEPTCAELDDALRSRLRRRQLRFATCCRIAALPDSVHPDFTLDLGRRHRDLAHATLIPLLGVPRVPSTPFAAPASSLSSRASGCCRQADESGPALQRVARSGRLSCSPVS